MSNKEKTHRLECPSGLVVQVSDITLGTVGVVSSPSPMQSLVRHWRWLVQGIEEPGPYDAADLMSDPSLLLASDADCILRFLEREFKSQGPGWRLVYDRLDDLSDYEVLEVSVKSQVVPYRTPGDMFEQKYPGPGRTVVIELHDPNWQEPSLEEFNERRQRRSDPPEDSDKGGP